MLHIRLKTDWYTIGEKLVDLGNLAAASLIFSQVNSVNTQKLRNLSLFIGFSLLFILYTIAIFSIRKGDVMFDSFMQTDGSGLVIVYSGLLIFALVMLVLMLFSEKPWQDDSKDLVRHSHRR